MTNSSARHACGFLVEHQPRRRNLGALAVSYHRDFGVLQYLHTRRLVPPSAQTSAAAGAAGSSATKRRSAFTNPAISSLPTLQGRPMPCCGAPGSCDLSIKLAGGSHSSGITSRSWCCSAAAAIKSRRPHKIPEACGPPMALAAAKGDQIRSGGNETLQVARRRKLPGRIHDHRYAALVRCGYHLFQRWLRMRVRHVHNRPLSAH